MKIPDGFIDLTAAYESSQGSIVNIIGVVVDMREPTITRTREHMVTYKIIDEKLRDNANDQQRLSLRCFRKDPSMLPDVKACGDVIMIKQVRMTAFSGSTLAVSSTFAPMVVFPSDSIPKPGAFAMGAHANNKIRALGKPVDINNVTLLEQEYVIHLRKEMTPILDDLSYQATEAAARRQHVEPRPQHNLPQRPISKNFGPKFRLVSELRDFLYADLCVEVVKVFSSSWGCELDITDYTENQQTRDRPDPQDPMTGRDGDQFNYSVSASSDFPGPFGQLTFKINAKYPHANFVNTNVTPGDLIFLRNVKCKARDADKLEGDMWPDDRSPERIDVQKFRPKDFDFVEIRQLLDRKERYWATYKKKHGATAAPESKEPALNKKQRKALRREKERAEKHAAEKGQTANTNTTNTTPKKPSDTNTYIRCNHADAVPVSSFNEILDPHNIRHISRAPNGGSFTVPFINAKYRARARVVDFSPKNLEDFSVPKLPDDSDKENEDESEYYPSLDPMDCTPPPSWEWNFSLLLEDTLGPKPESGEQQRMWVHVAHQDVQYLLGNDMEDPADLRNDERLLAKLREKMCILWGNLQEKGAEEALSNRPFECCLVEYGVQLDEDDPEREGAAYGYRKMFRLFGSTIS